MVGAGAGVFVERWMYDDSIYDVVSTRRLFFLVRLALLCSLSFAVSWRTFLGRGVLFATLSYDYPLTN